MDVNEITPKDIILKEINNFTPDQDEIGIRVTILDMIENIKDEIVIERLLKKISQKTEIEYSTIKKIFSNEYNKTKKIREEKDKTKPILGAFTNKRTLAEMFHKEQPYFYDRNNIWWMWNKTTQSYEKIDETDVLNLIEQNSNENTIQSKDKNEIIEALKQIGRLKTPSESSTKLFVQFRNKLIEIQPPNTFYNKDYLFIEREPSPEYFITNPIPYKLTDNDSTPIIDGLFIEWVGEKNKELLYEILAYSMYPDYPIHRIFCFVGSGSNGKGTFLRILAKFLGKNNLASTELELLVKNRFETAKLYRKLVCIMGETNFNELSQTSIIKRLTGQDPIGFELKNKNPFDDYNYAKIIIATNSLPVTQDKTEGFYRRWLVIDFNKKFSEKTDVLNSIPEEEYTNLTRKCLNILKRLLVVREFTNQGSIEERRERYEEKSNPLEKFLKEKTINDPNEYTFKYEFTNIFKGWCKANGFREWNETEIGKKMKERYEDGKSLNKATGNYNYCWNGFKWLPIQRNLEVEKEFNEEHPQNSIESEPDSRVSRVSRVPYTNSTHGKLSGDGVETLETLEIEENINNLDNLLTNLKNEEIVEINMDEENIDKNQKE